ncbi:MAG TPA: hypothetical protein VF801_04185 [Rhodocyclaceae bacterium]
MDSNVGWWVWVVGGVVTGALPLLGDSRLLGLLQTLAVVSSPFVIFSTVGAKWLPFALFYGALALVSSFVFRRRTARETQAREDALAAKKRNWS